MDPLGKGPVQVTLNATAAELLTRLTIELGEGNPSGVLMRALGLLEMAARAKRQGGKLLFENEHGDLAQVAF